MPFEIRNQAGTRITSVDDWLVHAPPAGRGSQWVDYRSAKECAKAYLRVGTPAIPREILLLLDQCDATRGFIYTHGVAEKKIRLDGFTGGTRNSDICLYGTRGSQKIAVGIEAKADEKFSNHTFSTAYREGANKEGSNLHTRVERLAKALFGGRCDPKTSTLRYQLLYSVAAVLLDAKREGASVCAFVVHEFRSDRLNEGYVLSNERDYCDFVHLFHGFEQEQQVDASILHPPIMVPGDDEIPSDIPILIGKVSTHLP